jgi:hypothetical protein
MIYAGGRGREEAEAKAEILKQAGRAIDFKRNVRVLPCLRRRRRGV